MTDEEEGNALAGFPHDARVLQLRDGSKDPTGFHGHLGAVPLEDFVPLGRNVGIALDEQFLLVDIDRACDEAEFFVRRVQAEPSWSQRSRRGWHWLYRTPAGFRGTNVKLRDAKGVPYGDIKTLGYLVGPGSIVADHVYALKDGRDPVPCPSWLLDMATPGKASVTGMPIEPRTAIPMGEQNAFVVGLYGYLRHVGLEPEAIARFAAPTLSLFTEQDERNPWTLAQLERKALSFKYPPGPARSEPGAFLPESWRTGDDASIVGPPTRWWVHGFIPQGELIMVYAKGGTGKSTLASWIAAEVTRKGSTFVVYGVEEPFTKFLRRSVLAGAERALVLDPGPAASVQFPRDAPKLRDAILSARPGVVYFDAITSHMDATPGLNIAERTRRTLGALAEIVQQTGTTIVCVFHENKAGDYGGSVEMLNVSRHVLHATRRRGHPLRLKVVKTNLKDPGVVLQFEGDVVPVVDPATGEVQMEENEDGVFVQSTEIIPRMIDPLVTEDAEAEDEQGEATGERLKPETTRQLVEALLRTEPTLSRTQVAERLGMNPNTLRKPYADVRKTIKDPTLALG